MDLRISNGVKLAPYTTFGIGGNALFFAVISKASTAVEALKFAQEKSLPLFVLGGGSNVLVSDSGFEGLAIKNEIMGLTIHGRDVEIGAGENWDRVVEKCIEAGLQGIECLSGIPGSSGGAIVQNIGAYGQTLSKVVDFVEALDFETGEVKVYKPDQCEFEYRNSLFKMGAGRFLVTKFGLKLNYGGIADASYPSVAKYFEHKERPSVLQVRQAVIEIRAQKGMVLLPGYEALKSAGSFFKNPVVDKHQFERIQHMISCPDPWHWNEGPNVKIAAACLVIQAGFSKGQMIGKAQISPYQPLAIVNPDNATAEDIKFTANHIKHRILDKFGIELAEEIVYI